jgi:hypothetical protein
MAELKLELAQELSLGELSPDFDTGHELELMTNVNESSLRRHYSPELNSLQPYMAFQLYHNDKTFD